MNRYSSYGANDDVPLNDGDTYWTGFYSRFQPTALKQGQAYYSGNMRLDKGTAKVRKGLEPLSNDIVLVNPTLIVGAVTLVADVACDTLTSASTTATFTSLSNHGYSSTNRVNIRGASPAAYNGDYTITVTGPKVFTYTFAGGTSPASGTIFANKGPRVFNVYSAVSLGSCVYANDADNVEGIVIASNTTAYCYRYGESTVSIAYPSGETCAVGDPCDLVQFLDKVYLFRGYQTAAKLTVSSLTQSAGTATCDTSTAHGLANNDWVTISGATPDGYNGIVQVTKVDNDTFTYTVASGLASPATGTIYARPCKPPLSWNLGTTGTPAFIVASSGPHATGAPYIKMQSADWAQFFTSRMVLPYSRDQIIMSDLLDPQTYDPTQTQFRILPGTNDWIVGAFPYQQLRLLVLYRKSVHALILDQTTLTNAAAWEITRNFGCVARKSVVNCGPYILWLSDIGVVRMEISNELNLKNTAAPLSDAIDDIIQTINWSYADHAVATFWNNRYYLAVPTGSSTWNNTVLVYNFLNEAWESVDTYPNGYDVLNFHVMNYAGTKRIHTVSTSGYVYLQEENDVDTWGVPGSEQDIVITGSFKTRNYLAGTYDMKKVKRIQVDGDFATNDAFTGTYVLSNPDYSLTALSYTSASDTDATLRTTVNRRGISSRLEITTTAGRPEFKAITAESAVTTRATLNYP